MITPEAGTAAAILGLLALPLAPSLVLLPVLEVMLNGTSSVLYGRLGDTARPDWATGAAAVPLMLLMSPRLAPRANGT